MNARSKHGSDANLPLTPSAAYNRLKIHAERIESDPQTNSVHALALEYFQGLSDGTLQTSDLSDLATEIGAVLQQARADTFRVQHFSQSDGTPWQELRKHLEATAKKGLDSFRIEVEQGRGGIVFTAHPTFSHSGEARAALAKLATSSKAKVKTNSATDGQSSITLAEEHAEAQAALGQAKSSLARCLKMIVDIAAKSFPADWQSLELKLPTVASWVGYDLDGRSDIHWSQTLNFRLDEKATQLEYYHSALQTIFQNHERSEEADVLLDRLSRAVRQTRYEQSLFSKDLTDANALVAASNAITEPNADRLIDCREIISSLLDLSEQALSTLRISKSLFCLANEVQAYGLGTAHIHLRINAAQIQTVLFRDLGLSTEHREFGRVALETLAHQSQTTRTLDVDFGDLFFEQSTARRQFMLCAQILKHIDSETPIRFLIAESENPATVMGAVYLAKQYGVDKKLDISPLFETPDALQNGGRFIERLLDEEAYRDYVEGRGRLSIQLGFSDAGRFIGQVAANMAIERIHNLIARALSKKIPGIDLLIFNTHGESMGRGGYPGSFEQRMDHLLTPWTRARCAAYGQKLLHEVSFQGGDGYLHFANPKLSDATIAAFLNQDRDTSDALKDPFYIDTNFVWDFYRALREWHVRLFHDRDYGALLGSFAGGFLVSAGSRPRRRSGGPVGPSSLRAISHNATLQQLGVPVNTAGGIGSSLRAETDQLAGLINQSQRLRALVELATSARVKTSVPALRGYADVYSPSFWISSSKHSELDVATSRRRVAYHLRDHSTSLAVSKCADAISVDLGRFDRLLAKLENAPSVQSRHEARLPVHALHAIRQATMMYGLQIAGGLPDVSARHGYNTDDVFKMIEAMRFDEAITHLESVFPIVKPDKDDLKSLGQSLKTRRKKRQIDYQNIHDKFLDPLRGVDTTIRTVSLAIAHAYGAYG